MRKIIYYSSPAYGNIYPVINMIKALINSGEKVIFYAVEKYKNIVQSCGAQFRSYPPVFPTVEYVGNTEEQFDFLEFLFISSSNILETTNNIIKELCQEVIAISPDYIIHDSYAHWGKLISSKFCIPAISFIPNYPVTKEMLNHYDALKFVFGENIEGTAAFYNKIRRLEIFLSKKYHIGNVDLFDFMVNEEKINISIANEKYVLFRDLYNDTFKFVGISPRQEELSKELMDIICNANNKGKKIIYISRGTVLVNDICYYRKCIGSIDTDKYELILSVGDKFDITDFPQKNGVHIFKRVEQNALLKKVDLFVTHGGHNSINEALYYGVPVIVYPLANDQFMCSKMIEKLYVGISIKSINGIARKIDYVLHNEQIKNNVQQCKKIYQDNNAEKVFVECLQA